MTIDKLIRLRVIIDQLWAANERGEDVTDRLNVLYRAATGRSDETSARRAVMVALAMVANHSDHDYERLLHLPVTDEALCEFVCGYLDGDTSERLLRRPREVAQAVRSWRSRGRPKRGQKRVGKWEAVAEVIRIARLASASFTPENAEQIWKEHGLVWEREGDRFIPTERL